MSDERVKQLIPVIKSAHPQLTIQTPKETRDIFASRVEELRNKGLRNFPIAQELQTSRAKVELVARRLIQEGRIESLRKRVRIEEGVRRFRNEGKSNQEIAKILGITKRSVEHIAQEWIKKGKIKPQRPKTG